MRLRGLLAVLGLTIACVSVACAPDRGVSQRSATDLEVVSWWTSGSEHQALTVLFDAYRAAHSGATVTNAAVEGGGGGNAQVVLTQRLLSGNPPDVWQTFPGGALRAYVDQSQVADLSDLYGQGGWRRPCRRSSGTGSPSTASSTGCRPAPTAATCYFTIPPCWRRPA